VLFHEATEKGTIPHVAIGSAGVHTSGLTSINREGMTLSIHAHFSRKIVANGVPGTVIGDAIISKAKDLNQAIDIARKMSPVANWAFVVTSAKDREGIVLECTPGRVAVRHSDGKVMTHTNFFQTRELNQDEGLICGAEAEDLVARNCRMKETLEPKKGQITPAMLCQLVGNHTDHLTGVERILGNSLSVVTSVKSVVFEPEDMKFWISTRKESPTGLDSEFIGVDVAKFWSNENEPPKLPGYKPVSPTLVPGMHEYRKAYRAWHLENDKPDFEETAYASARKAAEIHPVDGHVWVMAGILAFKVWKFDDAFFCLQQAISKQISSHLRNVCSLFIARCHDIRGDRDKAKLLYAQYRAAEDPRLRSAMRKGLWLAYKAKDTSSIALDLQFPDALHY
jgi:hypothetical protein